MNFNALGILKEISNIEQEISNGKSKIKHFEIRYSLFDNLRFVLLTQLSGFSEHEMNNPLALCELAARTPNISAGHMVKQAWLQSDRVFILDFHCHALM